MTNLLHNPVVIGAIMLVVSSFLMTLFKTGPAKMFAWVLNSVTAYIVVTNDDNIYTWFGMWLEKHPYMTKSRRIAGTQHFDSGDDGVDRARILFRPAPGYHLLWHNRRPFLLHVNREDLGGKAAISFWRKEEMTIRTLGRSQEPIRQICKDAEAVALGTNDNKVKVWIAVGAVWKMMGRRKFRPIRSIILPDGVVDEIVTKSKRFLRSADIYRRMGTPYQFGMLFEGAPGTGKTSLVKALAGELLLDVYIASISSKGMTDERLNELLLSIPGNCIVLFEDIDAAFNDRKVTLDTEASSVTFSGLLNAINGVAAKEGRILIMTTNHKEKLNPALIRKGRADLHVHFDQATPEQALEAYVSAVPDYEICNARDFMEQLRSQGEINMADVEYALLEILMDANDKGVIDGREKTAVVEASCMV